MVVKKGGLLKSAKKKKSCKSFDLQDSVGGERGILYHSTIFCN